MPTRTWREALSHPRGGFHYEELTPERQDIANKAVESLGTPSGHELVRQTIAQETTKTTGEIARLEAGRESVPSKLRKRQTLLHEAASEARGLPATGMEQSVRRVTETAMAPIKAVRAHAKETGTLLPVVAGQFYPERARIGKAIGERTFGRGSEESQRLQVASPILSARMAPEKEVRAAAGMAGTIRAGGEIGMTVGHTAAAYLSKKFSDRPPIESGTYGFDDIARRHPEAAAMLLQHGTTQAGIVVPSTKPSEWTSAKREQQEALTGYGGAQVHIPELHREATGAFVSGYGITGHPKGARALERFHADPESFGDFALHKIPSYTWNIHNASAISSGTHHFLGALAHGDKWFHLHPEAEGHIRRAMSHPAWSDPTSTIDVWSGRVASGLPYKTAAALGERTNPEDIMGFLGVKGVKRQTGGLGKASDLGYLYGEEAHRQAGAGMQVKLPSGGRVSAPPHVVQSLSWYGIQGEANPEALRTGAKTMAPKSMRDPRGLNTLTMPRTFGG
jgi:hypothetical protein